MEAGIWQDITHKIYNRSCLLYMLLYPEYDPDLSPNEITSSVGQVLNNMVSARKSKSLKMSWKFRIILYLDYYDPDLFSSIVTYSTSGPTHINNFIKICYLLLELLVQDLDKIYFCRKCQKVWGLFLFFWNLLRNMKSIYDHTGSEKGQFLGPKVCIIT